MEKSISQKIYSKKIILILFLGTLTAGTCNTIDAEFESFDYTETSSALRYRSGIGKTAMGILRVDFNRWPISFAIGVVTALVALFIQTSIEHLTNFKYNVLSTWFQKTYEDRDPYLSYMMSVAFNVLCCFLATLCCVVEVVRVTSLQPPTRVFAHSIFYVFERRRPQMQCSILGHKSAINI